MIVLLGSIRSALHCFMSERERERVPPRTLLISVVNVNSLWMSCTKRRQQKCLLHQIDQFGLLYVKIAGTFFVHPWKWRRKTETEREIEKSARALAQSDATELKRTV